MNTSSLPSQALQVATESQGGRNGTKRPCSATSGNLTEPSTNATTSPRAGFFADCAATRDAFRQLDWAANGFKIDISLVSPGFKQVEEFNRRMIQQQVARHCRLVDQSVQECVLGKRQFRSGKTAMPAIVVPERWSRMKDGTRSCSIPIHYHAAFICSGANDAADIVEILKPKMTAKLKRALRPCNGFGDRFEHIDVQIEQINPGESCKAVSYATKYAYDLVEHAFTRLP